MVRQRLSLSASPRPGANLADLGHPPWLDQDQTEPQTAETRASICEVEIGDRASEAGLPDYRRAPDANPLFHLPLSDRLTAIEQTSTE